MTGTTRAMAWGMAILTAIGLSLGSAAPAAASAGGPLSVSGDLVSWVGDAEPFLSGDGNVLNLCTDTSAACVSSWDTFVWVIGTSVCLSDMTDIHNGGFVAGTRYKAQMVLITSGAPAAVGDPVIVDYTGNGCSAAAATRQSRVFSFATSGGGTCLPDATVLDGQAYRLPTPTISCVPTESVQVGWSIPGQARHFAPGDEVMVSADQTFTAVPMDPSVTVTYDANVGMDTPCLSAGVDVTTESPGRWTTVTVSREAASRLAQAAPCVPPGSTLIGWTDRSTPNGSGQASDGALTLRPGDAVPASWRTVGPNPVNAVHLYALWGPA